MWAKVSKVTHSALTQMELHFVPVLRKRVNGDIIHQMENLSSVSSLCSNKQHHCHPRLDGLLFEKIFHYGETEMEP